MEVIKEKKLLMLAVFGVVFTGLVACSDRPAEQSESLEQRIAARWQHLIDENYPEAWKYYSPGFRQLNPEDAFVAEMDRLPTKWLNAQLLDLDCEDERCRATLQVTVQMVGGPSSLRGKSLTSPVTETWVQINDAWWFHQD